MTNDLDRILPTHAHIDLQRALHKVLTDKHGWNDIGVKGVLYVAGQMIGHIIAETDPRYHKAYRALLDTNLDLGQGLVTSEALKTAATRGVNRASSTEPM
ncbi:MAG: hypothetical protein ACR2Q4_06480 [Geminicoccaceae bacterium]